MQPPVLTIAGSDSSGGAGIQADLKTFTALQCYGTSVLTALTAQNTVGVRGIHACPPEFVEQQLRAVLEDIPIAAIKTGMLTNTAIVDTISSVLAEMPASLRPHLVVDPVMVSSSGHRLLESSAIASLQTNLLKLATVVTPNLQEALLLLGKDPEDASSKLKSLAEMKRAAEGISSRFGVRNVLVKGGHFEIDAEAMRSMLVQDGSAESTSVEYEGLSDPEYPAILRAALPASSAPVPLIVDVLYTGSSSSSGGTWRCFVRHKIDTTSTHGTGCTLSAAIACGLAKGLSVVDATREGILFTSRAIATTTPIGQGHGPLNHQHSLTVQSIPRPNPSDPHPFVRSMIASSRVAWDDYVRHSFVTQLGQGKLPVPAFKHFISQDYLYLKYYARAHGLLALKSSSFIEMSSSAIIIQHIARESTMHESYCATWGINPSSLATTQEATATTAYGAFILDCGIRGDALSLLVALCACLLGYGEVGLWLKEEAGREGSSVVFEGNMYRKWMEDYGGPDYQAACRAGISVLEERIAAEAPSAAKIAELTTIWRRCVDLERGFWDMAMTLAS